MDTQTLMDSLIDVVSESVSDVLISKGIEEDICARVANEVVALFRMKITESVRILESDIVKQAIKEADGKNN